MGAFISSLVNTLGLNAIDTPEDVGLSIREADDGTKYAFLINSSNTAKQMRVPELDGGKDLLTDEVIDGLIEMKPFGVAVVELH